MGQLEKQGMGNGTGVVMGTGTETGYTIPIARTMDRTGC